MQGSKWAMAIAAWGSEIPLGSSESHAQSPVKGCQHCPECKGLGHCQKTQPSATRAQILLVHAMRSAVMQPTPCQLPNSASHNIAAMVRTLHVLWYIARNSVVNPGAKLQRKIPCLSRLRVVRNIGILVFWLKNPAKQPNSPSF